MTDHEWMEWLLAQMPDGPVGDVRVCPTGEPYKKMINGRILSPAEAFEPVPTVEQACRDFLAGFQQYAAAQPPDFVLYWRCKPELVQANTAGWIPAKAAEDNTPKPPQYYVRARLVYDRKLSEGERPLDQEAL